MQKFLHAILGIGLTFSISISPIMVLANTSFSPNFSTSSELIDAVNSFRISRGLPPYTPNSILMSISQRQAEYNQSIGTITHAGPDGLRPFERALQAGYPVAGDLSLGGFFSENIVAGVGLSAAQAVEIWTGDDPHLNTMISPNLQDIGAGVAVVGNTFYYVIDCGLAAGGTPRPFTPPPSYIPPRATLVPNTPNPDGSITYIVQSGDTALGIALSYGISPADLRSINGLDSKYTIYTSQKLVIRIAYTPTPSPPTSTPTRIPTGTRWPTSTQTSTWTSVPPTSIPSPGLQFSTARDTVTLIIASALVIAALLSLLGQKRK